MLVVQSCLTLCNPMDQGPASLLCSWDYLGKNTGVGCCALQGIFLTLGSHLGFLHCRQILYCPSHQGSPLCIKKKTKQNMIIYVLEFFSFLFWNNLRLTTKLQKYFRWFLYTLQLSSLNAFFFFPCTGSSLWCIGFSSYGTWALSPCIMWESLFPNQGSNLPSLCWKADS